jgi:hypothetical protein
MKRRDVNIYGDRFTLTDLQPYGFSVGVRQWKQPLPKDHFILKTVGVDFDKALFAFPHTPILIDDVSNRDKFSRQSDLRVLDCPIKFRGSPEYNIPKELMQFDEVLSKCISYEHAINPNVLEYYAYITVDQGVIEAGKSQRNAGCQCDGFQGASVGKHKRPVSRTYIAYDCASPLFYGQPFQTAHLDEARHDFYSSFDEQSDKTLEMLFPIYSILLTGAYTVHKETPMEATGYRTFFRLHYDTRIFDRLGNTHNPLFNYAWPCVTRNIRKGLIHKRLWNEHAF